jgi:hypothetical protein
MVLRPEWLRLHRRWIGIGLGTVCATGLAISGCSRAPLTTFKEMTSAPPGSVDAATAPSRRSSEEPRSGDAVAKSAPTGRWREWFSFSGRETRSDKARRYQEEFAEFGRRVRDSRNTGSRDPFLEYEASGREFPSTDSLSPRPKPRPADEDQNTIARADRSAPQAASLDPAAVERRAAEEGVTRTQAEAVVQTTHTSRAPTSNHPAGDPNVPGTREASRLDQLRAELRQERPAAAEGIVRLTPSAAALPTDERPTNAPPRGDRGVILSAGQLEERTPTGSPVPATARGAAESTPPAAPSEEDAALRVQALLAAANWQAERGELEEAYRNVVLAQRLADRARLTYGPRDRRPEDLAQRIWEAFQRDRQVNELARSLPPPKLPPAAQRRPIPENVFAAGGAQSWRQVDGASLPRSESDSLPVVTPRQSSKSAPGAPSTTGPANGGIAAATPSNPSAANSSLRAARNEVLTAAAGSASPNAPTAGSADTRNPVTVGGITPEPSAASGDQGVITAHAESVGPPGDPTILPGPSMPITIPAMATLPKADRGLPAPGPALPGLPLAKGEASDVPPSLSVVGAKRLPPPGSTTPEASPKSRLPWGLIGLIAFLLTAAYAFRRRWSAASVKKP